MRKTVLLLSIIFLFICGGCTTQDLSSFSISESSHWDVSKIEEGNKNTSSAFETEQSKQTKEILNKSSKKNLETLITHSYPQKSIIETVNFLCSDNMSTLLNTLNEKYPVECLRTFQNSLDYVIYRLDEGGYLYVFFHGTSLKFADCIFVVKKPLQIAYTGSNINMSIDVSTIQYSVVDVVGSAILWNVNQLLPFPFDIITEELKSNMLSGEEYSFADMVSLSTELMVSAYTDNILNIVKEKNAYLYAAITALNFSKSVINTMAGSSIQPGDYAVQIVTYNNKTYDQFVGYYYVSGGKIYILDERYTPENRNVVGVTVNKFYQSYLGCPSGYLYSNRNEYLF